MPVHRQGDFPTGGTGGQEYDDWIALGRPDYFGIYSLQVNVGDTLDHLVVTYSLGGGHYPVIQHGSSNGGHPNPPFILDVIHDEFLVKVDVFLDNFNRTFQVVGLRFTTSKPTPGGLVYRTSDIYGYLGTEVSLEPNVRGVIPAFWGRQGLFVDALGIYVLPQSG